MADEKKTEKPAAGGGEEKDPRKNVKYTVQGTFYNPSAKDKTDKFEESVEGDSMSEEAANSAFYQQHSKKYPHYKIGSIKRVEDDCEKDASSPRHDGETARAGRRMDAELINRVCDAASRIVDRVTRRMDTMEKK